MPKFSIPVFLTLIGLAGTAQADQQPAEQRFAPIQDVFAIAQTPTSAATLEQLNIWSELLNAEQLQDHIETIQDSLPAEQAEWVLSKWLQQRRKQQPSLAVHQAVIALTHHQAKALAAHPDSPFRAIPAFNVSTTAAGTLQQWHYDQVRIGANRALRRNDSGFWSALEAIPQPATITGLKAAIAELATLPNGLPTSLIKLTNKHSAYAGLAIDVGLRRQHAQLLNVGLTADPALRPATLLKLDQHWSPADAESVWRDWLDHDDRNAAAAALAAIGRHRDQIADADLLLLAHLADPQLGATAAQALAHSTSSDTLVQLQLRLHTTEQPLLSARAALALRFSQQPEAEHILREYANSGTKSKRNKLQQEIAQWLR